MKSSVQQRFITYVQMDTQADPNSNTSPTTKKQLDLSNLLVQELDELGVDYHQSKEGYIYVGLPANTKKEQVPKLFFCAHIDTAPDASGTDVKPQIHKNYQGEDLLFPDDSSLVLNPAVCPELKSYFGQDIITASGKTLLGADDKSGVAVLMDAIEQLSSNSKMKHGEIMVLFTTDEEVGKGVAHVDLTRLQCDYGYTLDSGPIGHLEQENFSADRLTISIFGVSSHPGYAKGKMESAIKIASEIVTRLPKDHLSPESTEKTQGFVHPTSISGQLEEATIDFILRDFDTEKLNEQALFLEQITKEVLRNYPNSKYEISRKMQYRNMFGEVSKRPEIINNAITAMKKVGIEPKPGIIRGGTDGAMLTAMGLPCPNLFSGQHLIHSKLEWTSVQEMQKAVETVLAICELTEQNA